ncbi:antibiotic biosynthesis monooxygenase family protein [Nocardia sp. NPDC051030]|uniref:antibiotic biosynthesis monooxygenase family protein n=1 Tax=Nocardia sp. NPDC051030 TaxID=3155162 RepID=UPI00342DC3F1
MTDTAVTFINVFELPDEIDRDEFAAAWRSRVVEHMRTAPGFRDARLHRAVRPVTRFPLVNVSHWDSPEQAAASQDNPDWQRTLRDIPAGVRPNTGLYDIVHDFASPTDREWDGPGVTFMNVFEIDPAGVDEFAENWAERAKLMQAAPGFRDVLLHRARSTDTRFQLVNVAHWDSIEQWQAATQQPAMAASATAARAHATPNAAIYTVVVEVD